MVDAPARGFAPVAAQPYPWPFDGRWSALDTAVLLLGFETGRVTRLGAEAETERAVALAVQARSAGLLVLASHRRDSGDGTAGAIVPAVLAVADPVVVVHPGENAFFDTDLQTRLRTASIRNLLIAGLPTEGLMHASMRAANDMGFECLAVSDACKGTTAAFHEAQLRITTFGNGLFGTVAPTAAVLASLEPA